MFLMLGLRHKGDIMSQSLSRPFGEFILDLKRRGDVGELKKALDGLNEVLALPSETYTPLLEEAEANRQQSFVQLPKELRDAAAAEGLEFKASPPFYRVGCFTLKQTGKKPDYWDLTALDNVVVRSVQAHSGQELVKFVLEHITGIEAVLKQTKLLVKDLRATYTLLADALVNTDRMPPNLLLMLMNTKNARRGLSTGDLELTRPLSRAAFGYALAKLQKDPEASGLSLELKPATQLETAKAHTYVSVPVGSLDPRTICDSRPIASLRINA
jgi:hypothetical protein